MDPNYVPGSSAYEPVKEDTKQNVSKLNEGVATAAATFGSERPDDRKAGAQAYQQASEARSRLSHDAAVASSTVQGDIADRMDREESSDAMLHPERAQRLADEADPFSHG